MLFRPRTSLRRRLRQTAAFCAIAVGFWQCTASASEGRLDFGPICGAVSPSSAEVRVSVATASGPWSAIFRPFRSNGAAVVPVSGERSTPEGSIVVFRATGLTSDTDYTYSIVEGAGAGGVAATGRFRTFPDKPKSFRFAFASCARTGSNHEVFAAIRESIPLFFLHAGDLHYENIGINDPALFRAAYRRVFSAPRQAALLASVPLSYMWDDHDFGPNDSDAASPSRTASRLTYQEVIPHHPLVFGQGDVPIAQAFSVGRARFILTDLRSERSPSRVRDDASKTMMGTHQKEWFKREVLAAQENHAVIFWVSSVGWIAAAAKDGDNWGAYATERRELAGFFAENKVTNLIILSGDAHMLAADDGSNTNFAAPGSAAPLAVFQAASLDQRASFKGGPYSHGAYLPRSDEGCFGLVSVDDEGGAVKVTFSGRTHRQEEKIRLEVDLPARSR